MTAGAGALVRSLHPDWTPEQAKADLMNTAGQDVYTGPDHTGDEYAPAAGGRRTALGAASPGQPGGGLRDRRPGGRSVRPSGRSAECTDDAAQDDQGPEPRSDPAQLRRLLRGADQRPGADYSVAPGSVTVDAKSSKTVTLTLTLDPSQMTKTIDPTMETEQAGVPRQFQADASGIVKFAATSGGPDLRVPAYVAPRPVSEMTQAASVTLPNGDVQQALLPLTGHAVNQGSGATKVASTVAGFELQANSGWCPSAAGR